MLRARYLVTFTVQDGKVASLGGFEPSGIVNIDLISTASLHAIDMFYMFVASFDCGMQVSQGNMQFSSLRLPMPTVVCHCHVNSCELGRWWWRKLVRWEIPVLAFSALSARRRLLRSYQAPTNCSSPAIYYMSAAMQPSKDSRATTSCSECQRRKQRVRNPHTEGPASALS